MSRPHKCNNWTDDETDRAVWLYRRGASLRSIAKALLRDISTVGRHLRELGFRRGLDHRRWHPYPGNAKKAWETRWEREGKNKLAKNKLTHDPEHFG